jgi:hypothetical protein
MGTQTQRSSSLSGGDLYLSVRKENAVACRFHERQDMKVSGTVAWSRGMIRG